MSSFRGFMMEGYSCLLGLDVFYYDSTFCDSLSSPSSSSLFVWNILSILAILDPWSLFFILAYLNITFQHSSLFCSFLKNSFIVNFKHGLLVLLLQIGPQRGSCKSLYWSGVSGKGGHHRQPFDQGQGKLSKFYCFGLYLVMLNQSLLII